MQYFVETDTEGKPINRLFRSVIYQRAKKETSTSPFGTQWDVYSPGYEWIEHSIYAANHPSWSRNRELSWAGRTAHNRIGQLG